MNDVKCGTCGGTTLEPGFLVDQGEYSKGYLQWVGGALEKGFFGGAKLAGRPRHPVTTTRCTACGHLDLFVTQD